jgi:hypothetical protein
MVLPAQVLKKELFFTPVKLMDMTSSYTEYPADAPCAWGVFVYATWGRENAIATGRIVLHSS